MDLKTSHSSTESVLPFPSPSQSPSSQGLARPDNHLLETIKSIGAPIHPAGWMFIAIFAIGSLGLNMIWHPLGLIGLIATAWCVYFFRDPLRVTPLREGLIVRVRMFSERADAVDAVGLRV